MEIKQPKALALADALEDSLESYDGSSLPRRCQDIADEAAAELRRLHALNQELVEVLKGGPSIEHVLPFNNVCTCSQCEFVRLRRAAIAIARAEAA